MSTVGIKELKNRHSAERVASLEARLARLAAQGLVTLPTHKPLKRVRPVKVSGPPISKIILEDRR